MVKCTTSLNKNDNLKTCSPTILIEDRTGDQLPLILPENMNIEVAKKVLDKMERDIKVKFKTVKQLRESIYGKK